MKVESELHFVLVELPGEVVNHLVVDVHPVAGVTARRPELSNAADQDDGQARIGGSGAGAARGGAGGAQANRTGLKTLVLGEESFRKTVPAIPQLIYLCRSNRVYVRNRDQLHPRRGVGVEARKLAAASRQGQRERLRAVTKEVAAGQDIVGIEIVVDLDNEAT